MASEHLCSRTLSDTSSDTTHAELPEEDGGDTSSPKKEGQVDVHRAEAQFEQLRRTLTEASLQRSKTHDSTDLEKQDEEFDLIKYLRGTQEKRDQNGFHKKELGVVFEDLNVVGAGGIRLPIQTFKDAVLQFALFPAFFAMQHMARFKPKPKHILSSFDGCVKPGEMCLVLGRPGSGCSTFLKVIGNNNKGFLAINGNVTYGGAPASMFEKHLKGEVVYNLEDDLHHATLTVAQTLGFALDLKTPSKRLPNETRKDFKEEVRRVLLSMLGIGHTVDTLVGDAHVRGVSGGERKRVSIAEMMVTRASVSAWDNSTRGLDASTALDYVKSLRIMTDIFRTVTFVSLYQAGEGIYDQFDKVLLIDEGHEVYFGPAKEARPYMISLGYKDLPRQTSADYLTGCTDRNERQFADGVDISKVPKSPEELEESYRSSDIYRRMMAEKDNYKEYAARDVQIQEEFFAAVQDDKAKGVSKKSPYYSSFGRQVMALTRRQAQIKLQDRLGLYISYITAIVVAIIIGSCYLNLPETAAGAFVRGGVLFIALLFNALSAFNELPTQMMGRPIMWKQSGYALFRPGALTVAATVADLPFDMGRNFIFSVIIYFMAGLVRSGSAFFTFFAVMYGGYLSLSSFFRLLGCISFSYDMAARLAGVLVTAMVLYSGYMIPVYRMKRWLVWIYYINPLNWSFGALMANEFDRLNLVCEGTYIVPHGTGYPTALSENQVCTLAGATAGSQFVSGSSYISQAYQYSSGTSIVWRNFGFSVAFFLLFLTLQMVAMEKLSLGAGMPAINVFAPENAERKKLNDRLHERKEEFRTGAAEQDLKNLIQTRKPFTWEKLTYDVPIAGGQKRLLNDVFGYVKPGTLTALMGASGAGKTTLLDVLAQRKTIGVIGGVIMIGGKSPSRDFQRGTAYCEQLDVHDFTQTVREALRFSAYLRQPPTVPKEEKEAYVEDVIQLLEMEDIADAMIGFPGFGLGVEARKRLTIGVELAAKPQLLLFLDEPTSGLDGQSAYNIVRFLRKLASAGQAILCTIHQPNALLFENFDRLLLLQRGGRCVYFGSIGKDSHILRSYFERNGATCPPDMNPAEYMLEAIGAGSRKRVSNKDWADRWEESPEHAENLREIQQLKEEALALPDESHTIEMEYAAPFMDQVRVVCTRANLALWRSPSYEFTKLFNHMAVGLLTGLTFLKAGHSTADLQFRVFVIFMASVMPALIISQVEPNFIMAREVYIREASSKMYSQEVFALSQFQAEMPYSVICALVYWLLYYYPVGYNSASSRAGYTFLLLLITEVYSVTLGQMVASLMPSIFVASLCNPFLLILFTLFCGVTVPKPQLPKFWRSWMYELNPFTRLIAGLVVTELHDFQVTCLESEFAVFNPPSGQTCQQWAGAFVSESGGYLLNSNATSNCQYCTYNVGDEFYTPLGYSFDNRWRDLGIMFAFTIFNFIVTILGAKYLTFRYAKR